MTEELPGSGNKDLISVTATGHTLGHWVGDRAALLSDGSAIHTAISNLNKPVFILNHPQHQYAVSNQGEAIISDQDQQNSLPLIGFSPPISVRQLGDISFCEDYGLRLPYMCGSMANGIASVRLVETAAKAGLLASFGAAGLTLEEIENAVTQLKKSLQSQPFCFNLIFSPNEKGHEDAVVSLYIKHGINLVETSAYMQLTVPVVRYRVHGIRRNAMGEIDTPNRIIAKASRIEVAQQWFSPPPEQILTQLIDLGDITEQQATLAAQIPVAQDLTVEADSGGHTDNRPAITLLPTIISLRDRLQQQFNYHMPLRVGAAGGIATPGSAAAVFSMGAAYVVTGTVNQACIESGTSDTARKMLAEAEQADVAMAPAVDMFEMGVKLQVLKRGTMFAIRGNKLSNIYNTYGSIDEIPEKQKQFLEQSIFKASLSDVWQLSKKFFAERDPLQIEKAEHDLKHKMALIFRWYLGRSSHWANSGEKSRQMDYQIWCGPAMGAFNEWTRGSWLEDPAARDIVTVALNILYGASVITRINSLHNQGIKFSHWLTDRRPIEINEIQSRMDW